jgi:hypothetical protein
MTMMTTEHTTRPHHLLSHNPQPQVNSKEIAQTAIELQRQPTSKTRKPMQKKRQPTSTVNLPQQQKSNCNLNQLQTK